MLCQILCVNILGWTVVWCLDDIAIDLLTPLAEYDEACGYQACPEIRENYLNVHIVPATHGELGAMRTFYQHYAGDDEMYRDSMINMKNVFDSVITSLWSEPARRFTISDLPYFFHWWKNRDATVRRMVYQLIRQGRLFFMGGGWGMSDESAAHYHAIIDHYTYGLRKLNATFLECARPRVTWQADTFGHSREFASLMAQMGFDGHFINPISYDDELARMRSKSLEFVWRGSDDLGPDTDIFTHKLFDGYWSPPGFCFGIHCSDPLIVNADLHMTNVADRVQAFGKLMQVRQGPYYTTNNIMVVMGQRFGYYDSKTWFSNIDSLMRLVNEAKAKAGLRLKLVYSTPACYLKEVQRAQPVLRTKQDDFFPMAYDKNTFVTGMYYSRPSLKYQARELHLLLFIAKQLQMFGHLANNDRLFEDIQWMAGAILDHTILTGAMQTFVTHYYLVKIHKARQMSMAIIRSGLNKLRAAPKVTAYYNCPFNISSCWTTSHNRSYIVIYNPLAWPVTMPVRVPVQRRLYALYDHNGNAIKHSIMTIPDLVKKIPDRSDPKHQPALNDEMVFLAENLPRMGYRSYYMEIVTNSTENSRPKREILKKLSKNKKRKYLTRQSPNARGSDDNLINDYYDNDYLDENLTHKPPVIEFANVSRGNEDPVDDYDYVLTPKAKSVTTNRPTQASKYRDGFELPPFNNTSPFLLPSHRIYPSRSSTPLPTPTRTEEYYHADISPQKTEDLNDTDIKTHRTEDLKDIDIKQHESEDFNGNDIKPHGTEDLNETDIKPHGLQYFKEITPERSLYFDKNDIISKNTEYFNETDISPDITDQIYTTVKIPQRTKYPDSIDNKEPSSTASTAMPSEFEDEELSHNTESDDEGEITWDEERMLRKLEKSGYHSVPSTDDFIKNEHIKITLDRNQHKVKSVMLSNGVFLELNINMWYYVSDDPDKMGTTKKRPGAHVFRPMDPNPELISKDPILKVIKSELVQEAQIQYSSYAAVALSIYKDLPYVELDWLVGPIPIQDLLGKEVFIRYSTDIDNNGEFYTDSNGRQTIKRIKNMRSTYTPVTDDEVSSNFYPVVSKVYIEDIEKNMRFSVFPDRSEGCTSLNQGELDIMLHRRILTDDTGVNGVVNETAYDKGLVVRGKHRLYLSKADYKPNKFFEKKFAKELELQPKVFTSSHPYHDPSMSYENWSILKNEYSALKGKIPIGVHILSFEKWNHQLLIRLENYLEKKDVVKNGIKYVKILGLFKNYRITSCRETMLATHIWRSDYVKMEWQRDKFVKNFNDVFGNSSNLEFADDNKTPYEKVDLTEGIELVPQQIKTFVCSYELPPSLS